MKIHIDHKTKSIYAKDYPNKNVVSILYSSSRYNGYTIYDWRDHYAFPTLKLFKKLEGVFAWSEQKNYHIFKIGNLRAFFSYTQDKFSPFAGKLRLRFKWEKDYIIDILNDSSTSRN